MSCEQWRELLVDHIAAELGEEETILLEQHLAECPECSVEELKLRRVIVAATPTEIRHENRATEDYLVDALHERLGEALHVGAVEDDPLVCRHRGLWDPVET